MERASKTPITHATSAKKVNAATTAAKKRRRRHKAADVTRANKQSRITRLQVQAVQKRSQAKQEVNDVADNQEILGLAASRGDLTTVKKILSENPELINRPTNGDGYTPLHRACKVNF